MCFQECSSCLLKEHTKKVKSYIQNTIYPAVKVGAFSPVKEEIERTFRVILSLGLLLQRTVLKSNITWMIKKIQIKFFRKFKSLRLNTTPILVKITGLKNSCRSRFCVHFSAVGTKTAGYSAVSRCGWDASSSWFPHSECLMSPVDLFQGFPGILSFYRPLWMLFFFHFQVCNPSLDSTVLNHASPKYMPTFNLIFQF